MTETLEDFSTACRFCLETKKGKFLLLNNFYMNCYLEFTGEHLIEHHALPMTICFMCHREFYKFYDFRVRLKERQRKLCDLIEKSENLIEIESMAERVPVIEMEEDCDMTIEHVEIEEDQTVELKDVVQKTPKKINGKKLRVKKKKKKASKIPNLSKNNKTVHHIPRVAPLSVRISSRDKNVDLNTNQEIFTENNLKIHEIKQEEFERGKNKIINGIS